MIGGTPGSGDGAVQFTVAENTSTASRTGTLTIQGVTFTVAQGGAACTYALSSGGASVGAAAASGSVGVTAQAGCTWTASADVAWITFPGGAAGSGAGTLAYAVGANPSTTPRSGTVTVAGQSHTVTQAGATCAYAILPASASYLPAGAVDSVAVTAPSGCAWTASSGDGWNVITSGASGSGPGTVTFEVGANAAATSRSGSLTIAGRAFTRHAGRLPRVPTSCADGAGALVASAATADRAVPRRPAGWTRRPAVP